MSLLFARRSTRSDPPVSTLDTEDLVPSLRWLLLQLPPSLPSPPLQELLQLWQKA